MLRVDLRAARDAPVRTDGTLAPTDPALQDVDFTLAGPVTVTGRVSESGPGQWFWRGRLEAAVRAQCRRCLTDVTQPVRAEVSLLFTEDAAADDPSMVPVEPGTTQLDLAPVIREELILAVPEFPVCRDDCRGLCPTCGADRNAGPCECRPEPDPRWTALEALRRDDDSPR